MTAMNIKHSLLSILLLLALLVSSANDLGELSTSDIKMELTDLYYDMDEQLNDDHEINRETLRLSMQYLTEIMDRGFMELEQQIDFRSFEQKSNEGKCLKVNDLIGYLNLCSEFTYGIAKSR